MATLAISATNVWTRNSESTYQELKALSRLKGSLADEQAARCRETLNDLSDYLANFGKVTSHPLLLSHQFYTVANELRRQAEIAPLVNHEIFNGCFIISSANDGDLVEEFYFPREANWLDPAQMDRVLAILQAYKDSKADFDSVSRLFRQLNAYLSDMSSIFACECFKKQEFYETIFDTISKVETTDDQFDMLRKRIHKLCYARGPVGYSSRPPSAPNTPGSPGAGAVAFRADLNRRLDGLAPPPPLQLPDTTETTRLLAPPRDSGEKSSCCCALF